MKQGKIGGPSARFAQRAYFKGLMFNVENHSKFVDNPRYDFNTLNALQLPKPSCENPVLLFSYSMTSPSYVVLLSMEKK